MSHSKSGQSLVEFGFVLPALVIMLLIGVDLGFMSMEHQRALSISREIANAVYRDCSDATDDVCIKNVLTKALAAADTQLQDFGSKGILIASFYKDMGINVPPTLIITRQMDGTGGLLDCSSAPNPLICSNRTQFTDLKLRNGSFLQNQQYVGIGEVIYQHQGITAVGGFFGFFAAGGETYESTVV